MVTMSDVATEAGVSLSTVSHVLNKTRKVEAGTYERVVAAISTLGYSHNHLARAVARGGPTQSIGVALSARSNPYFGDVVAAIDGAAAALGSTMLLGETADNPDREYQLVTSLLERRVDGIILACSPTAADRTLPLLARSRTPSVLVDRLHPDVALDQVGTDNAEPTAALVDHLAAVHGHRRIGYLQGLPDLSTTSERLDGFRAGLQRNGCDADPALVVGGDSASAPAQAATVALLALRPAPTAIISGNNAMMLGLLREVRRQDVAVPYDVAVCCFDDVEWADLVAPPVTAVAQDWAAIGQRAVSLLAQRITDPGRDPVVERCATTMRIRSSCGCASAAKVHLADL